MEEKKLEVKFPAILGFAVLENNTIDQAFYKINDQFKYHVSIHDDIFNIDELHDGKIIRSSEATSVKEAFFNHFKKYDPFDCPIHEFWIDKITSVPFVYADYITKEDLKTLSFPQLYFVDIRIPFDKANSEWANEILSYMLEMKNKHCRIDQCIHITVFPNEVVRTYIPVLGVKLPVCRVYNFLKFCYDIGLIIHEKRFRTIVNRPNIIKNNSARVFIGDNNDNWLRYMINFNEI